MLGKAKALKYVGLFFIILIYVTSFYLGYLGVTQAIKIGENLMVNLMVWTMLLVSASLGIVATVSLVYLEEMENYIRLLF